LPFLFAWEESVVRHRKLFHELLKIPGGSKKGVWVAEGRKVVDEFRKKSTCV